MSKENLLEEIKSGYSEGYDMESSVDSWIEDDIVKLFDEFLSKGIVLNEGEKQGLIEELKDTNPAFFVDKVNSLFLKLLNLYNKNSKINGDNQDLYYVVDHFSPNPTSVAAVIKQIRDFVKEEGFISYIEDNFSYEAALEPYAKAKEDAKDDSEISDMLEEKLAEYSDEDAIFDMLESIRKEDFEDMVSKIDVNFLAKIYCDVKGNELTEEEKSILASEISEKQQVVIDEVIGGRSK